MKETKFLSETGDNKYFREQNLEKQTLNPIYSTYLANPQRYIENIQDYKVFSLDPVSITILRIYQMIRRV